MLTTTPIGANADAAGADSATFEITDAKLYVPIVTLSAEDNAKLSKLLGEGFKRSIYWNKYKVIDNKVVEIAANNEEKYIRELLDSSYQGVKRLFVLVYDNTAGNGRNFCDQPINDSFKQHDKIRKISTGQGDDYTTGCLLDFVYFEKKCRLIAADLSK